jgi:alpha-ketoglutaric semialdehyde dehydrogenase
MKRANFIDGNWLGTAYTIANINPANLGGVIGDYASFTREAVEQAVEAARRAFLGARLSHGGKRISGQVDGFYLEPALSVESSNEMRINRERIFRPAATVNRAGHYEEALHLANDTEFGLLAGICTTSLKHASHFERNAEAGMVMVNLPMAGVDYHMAFGGRKASSIGSREKGLYAVESFTYKTAYALP